MDIKKITRLVNKAKKGNAAAVAELYTLTSQAVYFTALKIVGNPTDAEDIVQDTYVTALSKLSDLKDNSAFPKWIKTIAANTAKNYILMKKPMLFSSDEEEERLLNGIPEISEDYLPDIAADKKETCRLVSDMVDRLTEKQRMAVVMYYYDEMTVSEIAEAMQTNENTVKSRLNYARKQIKDEVEALEKKGTRLYSIGAMPVLAMALKEAAKEIAVPETVSAGINAVASTVAATAGIGVKIAVISSAAAVSVLGSLTLVIGGSPDKIPFNQENTITEENVQTTDVRYNDYITSDMGFDISEFTPTPLNTFTLNIGETDTPTAAVWTKSGETICYSSNENIVVVSENGLVTAVGEGTAYVAIDAGRLCEIYRYDVVSPLENKSVITQQTVMNGKVKVIAEKKNNNTIVLTIENNSEKEVSTFGYPQIKANGMTQDLDAHLQLKNGGSSIFEVPTGEKGQITYYLENSENVEALIGELFCMEYFENDKNFSLEF